MPQETDRALEQLCATVVRAQRHLDLVLERAHVLREGRQAGRPYSELVAAEPRPLLVERLAEVLEELATASAAFRRSEARVLHDDGLSQESIAAFFGVTRQRVSALLRPPPVARIPSRRPSRGDA